jgi:replication initiation protein RepC
MEMKNVDANESRYGRHPQNSNPDHISESEPGFQRSQGRSEVPTQDANRPPLKAYPLGMVLEACPDIIQFARWGISSWREFLATASFVRSNLGISPSAWDDAVDAMGEEGAAIVVSAILQRGEAIKSPGGYLRNLTERARAGQFSVGPVLMALLRTKLGSGPKRA